MDLGYDPTASAMMGNSSGLGFCNPETLFIPNTITGVHIANIHAVPVTDFDHQSIPFVAWAKSSFSGLELCNVTVTYVHPGIEDEITVTVLLPPASSWNGRFMGAGGGGWGATMGSLMQVPGLDDGFAVASTDGGAPKNTMPQQDLDWALRSPGNPDIGRLDVWASRALHDMAVIGKAVTAAAYDNEPAYSYWVGCSTGGRQGHMLAQKYPEDFDGIAALAPAINWADLLPSLLWPRQIMSELNYYPEPCEIEALTAAAVEACDAADGLVDGVTSRPDLCDFDPISLVGQKYECNGKQQAFTTDAVKIAHAAWNGIRTSTGEFRWYGYGVQANLAFHVAATTCDESNKCSSKPSTLSGDWAKIWIAADPTLDLDSLTRKQFIDLVDMGKLKYDSIIGTKSPDLSRFRDAGGKMLNWHGMDDELIPAQGSVEYLDRVRALDRNVDDYYRVFLAPGTAHCFPGAGPFPTNTIEALMDWVERSKAPEQLVAQNISNIDPTTGNLQGRRDETAGRGRPICKVPEVLEYVGGDADLLSSFRCVSLSGA